MEEANEPKDEFDIQIPENDDIKATTVQRLKEFSFYLTESVEKNLNFCLALLESRSLPKKPNSDSVTAISTVATPIPYIGKGISSALKEGEIYILNKVDQKNSRTVADLVFFFSDNREAVRQSLIEASSDLFYCFENQFLKLTCDGGPRRAMQKLAKDASNRIFTQFLGNKQSRDVSKDDFCKAVIFGGSLKNKLGRKTGKTVENENEEKWKTSSIYNKVGLFLEDSNEFFKSKDSKCEKYGYRRLFMWEDVEKIREEWSSDTPLTPPVYNLKRENLVTLYPGIREYIMEKTVEEESQLDRERKHQESLKDHQAKHEEVVETLMENFGLILDEVARNYEEIKIQHQKSEEIVTTIKELQVKEDEKHLEITEKLTEIHTNVLETKEGQIQLQQTNEDIKTEICVIKTKQEEFSNTASQVKEAMEQVAQQQTPTLSDLVKDNYEVKKITKIVNEVKESISDVEPRVRKEIKRSFKKLFK